jgi:hypothetical protein
LTLDASQLAAGFQQAELVFASNAKDKCELPVSVTLVPAVRAVPETIVFGPSQGNSLQRRTTRLVFSRAGPVPTVDSAVVRADVPGVDVQVGRLSDRVWNLTVTLAADAPPGLARGLISVEWAGSAVRTVGIPVSILGVPEK